MEIIGQGLILKVSKFQERNLIITLLTENDGVMKGLIRTSNSKRTEKFFQGDFVHFTWNARLKEHLGFFKLETTKKVFPQIINEKMKIHILESTLGIVERVFKEGDPINIIYNQLISILNSLISDDIRLCLEKYVLLELSILQESGYGLDLSKCVATNSLKNLIYISPKSGCAVSADAGEIYKSKLFNLPSFLSDSNIQPSVKEIFETLKITEHFLIKFIGPYTTCPTFAFRSSVISELENIIESDLAA